MVRDDILVKGLSDKVCQLDKELYTTWRRNKFVKTPLKAWVGAPMDNSDMQCDRHVDKWYKNTTCTVFKSEVDQHGKKHGRSVELDLSGGYITLGRWKKDLQHGESVTWLADGEKKIDLYEDGLLIKESFYDDVGNYIEGGTADPTADASE
jgi:hypothetical protein